MRGAGIFIDHEEVLHLIYSDHAGAHHRSISVKERIGPETYARAKHWSKRSRVSAVGGEIVEILGDEREKLLFFVLERGELFECRLSGERRLVASDCEHPSVYVDEKGTRHVAFERGRKIFYTRAGKTGEWRDRRGKRGAEIVACFCSSWPSIIKDGHGRLLIAFQGEGKVELRKDALNYAERRGRGGMTVSYAILGEQGWVIRDFLRSREILINRRGFGSFPQTGDHTPFVAHMEELWRPSLTRDLNGVVWMFFLNSTRRHVYFSRFTGDEFAQHHEARGAYDLVGSRFFLQKDAGDKIGYVVEAANRFYFDAIPVPDYSSEESRRLLFLDNLEWDEMIGIEHVAGSFERETGPLKFSPQASHMRESSFAWCEVVKGAKGFAMNYTNLGSLFSTCLPGRASSRDGVHWKIEKPFDREKMSLNGEPFPNSVWHPIALEDSEESDPERRYKGLVGMWHDVAGLEYRSYRVVTSGEGMHWKLEDLEPVVHGDINVGSVNLMRDDQDPNPERRYKVVVQAPCHAGRCVAMFTSPDLLHWDRRVDLRSDPEKLDSPNFYHPTGHIALDPDGGENDWEEEIHDASLWRENGMLMFHYDAFYFHANQHVSKALGISRDGRHFWRVKRGVVNLDHGACGEWDNGRVRTAIPVAVKDELWLYHCGMPASCMLNEEDSGNQGLPERDRPWGVGLSKMRKEGWAFVRKERDREAAMLTSIPFSYRGGELVINAENADAGKLQVEIRREDDGAVIRGFSAKASRVRGNSGTGLRVEWGGSPLMAGVYRLRVWIHSNRTRLYALGFQHSKKKKHGK